MSNIQTTTTNELGFFDPFFEAFFGDNRTNRNYGVLPMKSDIKEYDDHYEIEVEIPGFEKKDISLKLEDGYLTVTAQVNRFEERKDKKAHYIRRERFSGVNSRSFFIGDVEQETIKAGYDNGVLLISFPKENEKEAAKKHTINID